MQGETHQEQTTEQEEIETMTDAAAEMLYKGRNSESVKTWN